MKKKKELAKDLLLKKFQDYGFIGLIKHLYFKSILTFADGTYYIPLKVSLFPLQKENIFLDIFSMDGKYFTIYFYIAQGIHMVILLLSIYSVYLNCKENNKKDILFTVPILCLFLLLLVWETRSRYVLNYSLLLYILVASFFKKISLEKNRCN